MNYFEAMVQIDSMLRHRAAKKGLRLSIHFRKRVIISWVRESVIAIHDKISICRKQGKVMSNLTENLQRSHSIRCRKTVVWESRW